MSFPFNPQDELLVMNSIDNLLSSCRSVCGLFNASNKFVDALKEAQMQVVHCTLYTVRCTPYTVHRTTYTVHCKLYCSSSCMQVMGRSESECLHLHQEVKTRWNSSYEMLLSISRVQEALQEVLSQEQWKKSPRLVRFLLLMKAAPSGCSCGLLLQEPAGYS